MREIISPLDGIRSPFGARFRLFDPGALFAAGEPGAWYDPSDITTLFQDSAGTTPVTAVEQPVGLMLDKSGRGNHATQSNLTSRPVLSARYNLLTHSQDFSNVVWVKFRCTVSADATTAPDGTTTADLTVQTAGQTTAGFVASPSTYFNAGDRYITSIYAKAGSKSLLILGEGFSRNVSLNSYTYFNLSAGTVATKDAGHTATIEDVGGGWYRCSIAYTSFAARVGNPLLAGGGDTDNSLTVTDSGGIYIWGADLRVANDGVGLPVYQRVNTASDYDTVGFPYYLRFDGVDDSMATGSINFTSTSQMSVFAGVRKLSDASVQMLYELSADFNSNNGVLAALPGYSGLGTGVGAYWHASSKGTNLVGATSAASFVAPQTAVQTHLANITADSLALRINGVQVASAVSDQGTGNYGNHPLYIGARGGSSLRFNGRLYSLTVLGRTATATEITNTETWVNGKTKAF